MLISGMTLNQSLTKMVFIASTNLFSEAMQQAIEKHDSNQGPFFIYAAYQSVHFPLEAPQQYIDQCQSIPYEDCRTFCGMLRAADEGISNILDDTIIIYSLLTMEARLHSVAVTGH